MATAVESSAASPDQILEEQARISRMMGYDLVPAEGEAGPSNYNTPSSRSLEEGVSPLDPTTIKAILAEPLPGLERTINDAIPDSSTDSTKSSRTSSKKGKEKEEENTDEGAAPLVTEDSEAAKKGKGKEKTVATAPMLSDAELALKRQKEREEEEKGQWLERYRLAQPGEKLLSVQDPKFQQLLAEFRFEKERAEQAERERRAQGGLLEGTNPEPKSKLRTVLSRLNLRRRFSGRRARRFQAA